MFAIVWRGWGILAGIIPVAIVTLIQGLAINLFGTETYQRHSELFFALGLFIASPLVWLLGRRLNRGRTRILTDEATGERVALRNEHSMFWIKFEHWALIFAAVATAMTVYGCQQEQPVVEQPETSTQIESVPEQEQSAPQTSAGSQNSAVASSGSGFEQAQSNIRLIEPEPEPSTPEATAQAQPSSQAMQTQPGPGGMEVDLIQAQVNGDVLTVTLRYRLPGDSSFKSTNYPISEVSYIDSATSKRYGVLKDQSNSWLASPKMGTSSRAGELINFGVQPDEAEIAWFKFPAPPPEAETISINVPEVAPFNSVAIQR